MSDYTRVEIIDHRSAGAGRVFVHNPKNGVVCTTSEQDDGKTLKVFIYDTTANTQEAPPR